MNIIVNQNWNQVNTYLMMEGKPFDFKLKNYPIPFLYQSRLNDVRKVVKIIVVPNPYYLTWLFQFVR